MKNRSASRRVPRMSDGRWPIRLGQPVDRFFQTRAVGQKVGAFVAAPSSRVVEGDFGDRVPRSPRDAEANPGPVHRRDVFAEPLQWHQPRIPGYGEIDWPRFLGALTEVSYDGPVCIEVEDDTFGKTLAGSQRALKVAGNVLRPFFA